MSKTFIMNSGKPLSKPAAPPRGQLTVQFFGLEDMSKAISKMQQWADMDRAEMKKAIKILKDESKPMVRAIKANAPKSSKMAFSTMHRHVKKGSQTTIERQHKPGQLQRSIGTLTSKRFKNMPLIYVGVRSGTKYKDDGWYAHLVEFGRKAMTAEGNKHFYFPGKNGEVVKTKRIGAIQGNKFFARAMNNTSKMAMNAAMSKFGMWMGATFENKPVAV